MRTRIIRSTLTTVAFAVSIFGGPSAVLTGRVTDSGGVAIPHAAIEARAIETNTIATAETNSDGFYSIPNLAPGFYRVIVRKTGLKTIVKPGIELHVQDIIALNFSMQIGSVIESITEPEGAPLISADSSLGITISHRTLAELPTLTRNPYDLAVVAPGATQAGVSRGIGFAVNGQRAEAGNVLLDGGDNNNAYTTGPGQSVPL